MNLQRLDLNLLRIFVAVHTHGSVTATASAMHLSQPAVSNALARLRRELGDELFTRQGMGLQPTALALRLAPKVRGALAALTDALTEAPSFDPLKSRRQFRLAMTDAGHQVFLPKLAQALHRSAPQVSLQSLPMNFDTGLAAAMGEGHVDLVIGPLPPQAHVELDVQPLFNDHYVAALPRRMLTSKVNKRLSLAQLKALPIVVVEQEASLHMQVPQALAALGLQDQIRYRVPYFSASLAMITACDAMVVVPSQIGERFAKMSAAADKIVVRELPLPLKPYAISLASHPRFSRDGGLTWLKAIARTVLSASAVDVH